MIIKLVNFKLPIIVLLLMVLGFLGGGIGIGISNIINLSESTKIIGTIIDCGHEERTLVEYIMDNQVYTQYINESSSLYFVGKEIELFYSYKTNLVYTTGYVYLLPIMFSSFDLIFLLISIIMIIWDSRIQRMIKKKHEYIKKTAKVVGIIKNRKFNYNGRYPDQFICEVYFEGDKLNIKSPSFWTNITYEENYVVDVYFKDKNKYVVDVNSYRKDELFYEMDV